MTWDELLVKLGLVGIGYAGIGTDENNRVIIYTDLFVKKDGGGNEYLAYEDEFKEEVEG